jgi:P27 family predicted phage terminase small subunit
LKLVKGTQRPSRTNTREPKLKYARLDPPANFPDAAKKTWREIANILYEMKVLTNADPLALEQFALALADYRAAREELSRRDGFSYEVTPANGGASTWKPWPEVAIVGDLERRCLSFFARFGMTPADRSRVSALADDPEANPFTSV